MNKILVQLPANRDFAGMLEIQNAGGKRIAGPFRVCGRADDESARKNKNPGRDPLLPFGDLPFGEYQILKIIPTGEGTPYTAEEFGLAGMVLMRPKAGDAALADANGRFGFFIHGGARSRKRLLRPTQDGSLRLADGDQRRFIQALRKMGEGNSFCLVVCTAKVGAKVAVAAHERPRGNTPASLLLASSVAASAITGAVRQVVVRNLFPNLGASIAAAGIAFVAEHHASAQSSDYGGGGGASGNNVGSSSTSTSDASTGGASDNSSASGTENSSSSAASSDTSGSSSSSDAGGSASGTDMSSQSSSAPDNSSSSSSGMENTTSSSDSSASSDTGSASSSSDTGSSSSASDVGNPSTTASPASGADMSSSGSGTPDATSTIDNVNPSSSTSGTSSSDNTPSGIPNLPGIYLGGSRSDNNVSGASDTTSQPISSSEESSPSQTATSSSGGAGTSSGGSEESSSTAGTENPANVENGSQNTGTPADQSVIEYDNQNAANAAAQPQTPSPDESQLNTVEENSQNATHAITDEQAHQDASQGFDTPASAALPVDLSGKQGIVSPDAASGETAPAPAAGMAPGSPIIDESQRPANPPLTPQPGPTPQAVAPNPDFSVGTSDTTANNFQSINPSSLESYNGDAVVTKALAMKDTWNADESLTYKQIPKENYPAVSPNISADNTSDCSHFVNEVLQNSGHSVPYVSTAQIGSDSNYQEISAGQAQPGDIIVQYQSDGEGHMGVFTGQKVRTKDGKLYPYGLGFGTSDMVSEAPWSATGGSGTAVSSGGPIKYYRPLK